MSTLVRILTGRIEQSLMASASAWLHDLVEEFGIGPDDAYRIDLCFEELVMNTISYAEPECQGTRYDIRATLSADRIVIELIDTAQQYDPFAEHVIQEIPDSLEDLQIGGHGITLVKEYTDECSYVYEGGRNHLTLAFNLAHPLPLTKGQDGLSPACHRISESRIFSGVPCASLAGIVDRFPLQRFAAETPLLQPGDRNQAVFFVMSGSLKIGIGEHGHGEHFEVGVGGCVGEMSVIDNQPVSAEVVASENTCLLAVDAKSFLEDLMAIPLVARNLLSAQSDRMRRNNDFIIKRIRIEMEMEQIQRELGIAKEIQESLLPHEPLFPGDSRIDCKGRMCTAKEVGGDFYDIFPLDQDNVFFVIGDVCGKGLPAALFMVRAVSALRAQSGSSHLDEVYVAEVISRLNAQLCTSNDKQQFLTAFCGILNLSSGAIRYVNAGHNPPLISQGDGSYAFVSEPINPIVGMIDGLEYVSGATTLPLGGSFLLYTDGVTEAETHDMSMFDESRLLDCMNAAGDCSASDLVARVFEEVDSFAAGAPQSDDITVLAIRRLSA